MHFFGLISKLVVFLIKEEMNRSNVQLLKESKKKLLREVYLLARRLMFKLIVETRVYICHKNMKSMGIFLQNWLGFL